MVDLGSFTQAKFWRDWEERFMENYEKYINPSHRLVEDEASKVEVSGCCGHNRPGESAWAHVHREIAYKLSKEWKTPQQTIREGIGDCEDMDFLMLSMLPHLGVDQAYLVIGNIETQGKTGAHTWVELDGKIMDPTGSPEDVQQATYDEVERFKINFN